VGEVKFRVNNNWRVNWGSSLFPEGIGMPNGADIPISTAGTYIITFNDITGDYAFTIIPPGKP
jgi:hypothetical protein